MSWNQWNTSISNTALNSQVVGSSIPNPNATNQTPYNPSVMPPGGNYTSQFSGMTPEQQFAMQQNWQQWQSYQQQYAQWHAQYGEQYKREMEVKLGGAPPSLPFSPTIPNTSISQFPQIVPPTAGAMYAAPPPPPENDIKKSNDVINEQPPPPPPPPENANSADKLTAQSLFTPKMEMERSFSHNYNRNMFAGNKQMCGNNERDTSEMQSNRIKNFQYEQSCDERKAYKNSDVAIHSNESIDNATQNNANTSAYLPTTESKSREEKIFDEQFRKWEEEFENWKKANVNHPDKKAYREYEMKFEDCRRKLIERREQMRRKKLQQEQQAMHEQQLREQHIREDQIKQEHQKKQEEEKNQQQQTMQENQILQEKRKEPSQSLGNNIVNEPKDESKIENVLFEEEQEKLRSDIIEINSDFTQTGKKEFEIPGLDLVQTDLPKKEDENTNVIDLEKIDEVDDSRPNLWDKKGKIEKSRWGNNERNKEKLQKDWNSEQIAENYGKNSGNDKRSVPNKIPSLFDFEIEKPTFSPPREKKTDSCEIPKFENTVVEDNLKETTPIENESNNMRNLANALANPNVMALLSAALQKNDHIPISNEDINEQERNYNKIDSNYNSDQDNPFFGNQFGNRFGGGNANQNRGNECYNSNQGNHFSRSRLEGGNKFAGNRGGINIPIWENNINNNWRHQNNSDLNMESNSYQPIWDNQQSLSHRNPFNASNRGSRGDLNDFEDTDSRNIFDNNRGQDREWDNVRNNRNNNKNRRRSNKNNRKSNSNSASSSINNDNNFDQNLKSDNNVNPFKRDLPIISKSPNLKQQQPEEEEYFRPAHVIDYQNKSLSEVINPIQKETETIPTKIVDYGHKAPIVKNISSNIKTENFFPMKTIDYGHASTKTDLDLVTNKQSFGDFLANRTNMQKRKADDDIGEFEKKKKITIVEQSKSEYSDKWTSKNIESSQRLLLPINGGKKKINNINILNINDCKTNDKYISYSSKENLDAVSDLEKQEQINDFIKKIPRNDFDETNFISNNDDKFKEDLDPFKLAGTIKNITSQNLSTSNNNKIKNDKLMNENIVVKKSENNINIHMSIPSFQNNNTILIDEIILNPGRMSRPKNIVIIFRGPPGSGKSYIAKLIKDKEIELHASAPRLLSIDDYFMIETDKEEKCPNTGRKTIRKELVYEYDNAMESKYFIYLMKSFKKTLLEQHFNFIIVDCVNHSLRTFTEFYNFAKLSNYTPYTIDLHCKLDKCLKQNIHNRSEEDIINILKNWNHTPDHYIKLDTTNIVKSFKSPDADQPIGEKESEVCTQYDSLDGDSLDSYDSSVQTDFMKCKWDVDTSKASLARLDGTRKSFQTKATLEDYLQMDGWEPPPSNSNKKRVRWADIEEKREQDKMRAIGFVVGQTDWNRMLDPTGGSSALTQTKFIEKLSRKK